MNNNVSIFIVITALGFASQAINSALLFIHTPAVINILKEVSAALQGAVAGLQAAQQQNPPIA